MLTDEQKAAGWIEHDGGPCPVAPNSKPGVIIRGFTRTHVCQMPGTCDEAQNFSWAHCPHIPAADIIAYRPENPHD